LSDVNENWIFSTDFPKKKLILNFAEIRPVVVELFHSYCWTDGHDEVSSRFSQFCESSWETLLISIRPLFYLTNIISPFLCAHFPASASTQQQKGGRSKQFFFKRQNEVHLVLEKDSL